MESAKLNADNKHLGRLLRQQSNALVVYVIYFHYFYIVHLSFKSEFSRQL